MNTVGTLVGRHQGRIAASWAGGVTGATGTGAGLVGASAGTITTSYSTGAVTGGATQAGFSTGGGTVVASYWDTTTSAIADDQDSNPPEGRTTTALATPTAYGATGLYAAWDDQDVDGDGTSGEAADDDAWHFGDAYSHPVLKFAAANTRTRPAAAATPSPPGCA